MPLSPLFQLLQTVDESVVLLNRHILLCRCSGLLCLLCLHLRVRQGRGKSNCSHAAVRIDRLLWNVGRSGCRIIAHNTSLLVHPVYRISKKRKATNVKRRTKNIA